MVDAWRMQHLESKVYTSPAQKHWIEYVFVSQNWTNHTTSNMVPSFAESAHHCPTARIRTITQEEEKGHWQLPTWVAQQAANLLQPEKQQYAMRSRKQQLTKLDAFMKEIIKLCPALHRITVKERQNRITKACNRWRKCNSAAIQSPGANLTSDAIVVKRPWQKLTTDAKHRNEGAVFDRHFNLYKSPSRELFRQAHCTHKRSKISGVELADGTLTDDIQIIQNIPIRYWEALFSRNGKARKTPPTPSLMTDIINNIHTKLTD